MIDPVEGSDGLVLFALVNDNLLVSIDHESLLSLWWRPFFLAPIRELVVANSRGVLFVCVPLLNELFGLSKVLEAIFELLYTAVGLVLLREILHELGGHLFTCGNHAY